MFSKLKKIWMQKFSKTPWFEFEISDKPNEDGSMRVIMDWNDAFIVQIRKMGIFAQTEEEMVEIYLNHMFRQQAPDAEHDPMTQFQPVFDKLENGNVINRG